MNWGNSRTMNWEKFQEPRTGENAKQKIQESWTREKLQEHGLAEFKDHGLGEFKDHGLWKKFKNHGMGKNFKNHGLGEIQGPWTGEIQEP